MKLKRVLISILAFIAIIVAIYGFWSWQKSGNDEPIRQENEIR